jgi:PhzF family phenazine biosynthesis protein
MGVPIIQVDAFTDKPFAGNPAAVCVLPEPCNERWMQKVACEMNLSETAFLHKRAEGFDLRWFSPATEAELCGHATLASAHVLWEEGYLQSDEQARFYTRSGILTAERKGEWIELDFPLEPEEIVAVPAALVQALGVTPKYVGKNRFDYLVEVESEAVVLELKPDFTLLSTIPARGIIVTSLAANHEFDFVSRFFSPKTGVNEDPVTGSAHCCLGPFWKHRLNKHEFVAYQASARGGVVRVRMSDQRAYLGGQAITVLRGELLQQFS